jgi:predicted AlkP superfamily pyrophosphatase or phosphodiesterase
MDKKKKLIVFSADAMVTEDLEHLKKMPNYQKYLAKGCVVERVKTIYPTITYPCHTSMCTGVYPNKHGIYGNIQFIPGLRKGPWKWFLEWRIRRSRIFLRQLSVMG